MNANRRQFTAALMSLASVLAAGGRPGMAETYPARPVKIVVPYAAGGPMDAITRMVAQKMTESTGGQFIVENQPGAAGSIGAGAVANAPKDGYTILIANQDMVIQPHIKAKVAYDVFSSFAPVIEIAGAPELIVVNPSLPVKSMAELLSLLKANPGKYSYASPGFGSSPHLACEWLFKLTYGLDVVHVPFPAGAVPAVTSTLAGDTPILHILVPAVSPYIKEGKLRPLAVASRVRSPVIPEVPTFEQAGVPGHEVGFWMGVLVPSGTPRETVDALERLFAAAVAHPDVKQRLAVLGFTAAAGTSQEFASHIKAESDKWRRVISEAHIRIE